MKATKATEKNSDNSLDTTPDSPPTETEKAEIASGTKARVRETTTRTKVYISDVKAAATPKPAAENGSAKASDEGDPLETVLDVIDQIISSGIGGGMKIRVYKVRNYDGSPPLGGRMYLGQKPFNPATHEDDIQALCADGGELAIDFCYPDGKWYERGVPFSCGPSMQQQPAQQSSMQSGQSMTFAEMQKMQSDMKLQVLQEMKIMKEIVGGGGSGGGDLLSTIKTLKELGLIGGQQSSILDTVKIIGELRNAFPDSNGGATTFMDVINTAVQENPGVIKEATSAVRDYFTGRMRPNIVPRPQPRADADVRPEPETNAIDAGSTEATESEPAAPGDNPDAEAAMSAWLENVMLMISEMIGNHQVDKAANAFVAFKGEFPNYTNFVDQQINRDPDVVLKDIIESAGSMGAAAEAQQIADSKTARGWLVRLKDKITEIEKFRQMKNSS